MELYLAYSVAGVARGLLVQAVLVRQVVLEVLEELPKQVQMVVALLLAQEAALQLVRAAMVQQVVQQEHSVQVARPQELLVQFQIRVVVVRVPGTVGSPELEAVVQRQPEVLAVRANSSLPIQLRKFLPL